MRRWVGKLQHLVDTIPIDGIFQNRIRKELERPGSMWLYGLTVPGGPQREEFGCIRELSDSLACRRRKRHRWCLLVRGRC